MQSWCLMFDPIYTPLYLCMEHTYTITLYSELHTKTIKTTRSCVLSLECTSGYYNDCWEFFRSLEEKHRTWLNKWMWQWQWKEFFRRLQPSLSKPSTIATYLHASLRLHCTAICDLPLWIVKETSFRSRIVKWLCTNLTLDNNERKKKTTLAYMAPCMF